MGGARLRRELSNQFCDRYMMEDTGPLYYNYGSNTQLLGNVKKGKMRNQVVQINVTTLKKMRCNKMEDSSHLVLP